MSSKRIESEGYPLHPAAELFPPMSEEEFAALCEDIRANGQHEAIVLHRGQVIDGRNRLKACAQIGISPMTREWNGNGSVVAYVISENLHRRHLSASQKATVALDALPLFEKEAKDRQVANLKRGNVRPDVAQMPPREMRKARDDAAKAFGVSPRYIQDAKAIQQRAPEMLEDLRSGKATITEAKRELKERDREARREENRAKAQDAKPADVITRGAKFATIVIDPPWDWGDEGDGDQLGRARPDYATMPLEDIRSLPVPDLADVDCHLYMWITNRSLPKGFSLLESWGFRYVTCLTWCKPSIGMGNYFRGSTEHLLFAVKGSQQLKRKDVGTWFAAPRGNAHSSKPTEAYALIESCSPGPYLEMFSRSDRDGWIHWGADAANAAA